MEKRTAHAIRIEIRETKQKVLEEIDFIFSDAHSEKDWEKVVSRFGYDDWETLIRRAVDVGATQISFHVPWSLSIFDVPESLSRLDALEHFSLKGSIIPLPDVFAQLPNLKSLSLGGCSFIRSLPRRSIELGSTPLKGKKLQVFLDICRQTRALKRVITALPQPVSEEINEHILGLGLHAAD